MPEVLPAFHSDLEALRPFGRIRLVAFDLDGTLLPSALIQKFQELSRSLRRNGVALVVATGRTLSGVEPLVQRLELGRKAPLILYNGSLVVENSTFRVISRRTISHPAVSSIVDACGHVGARALAYYYNERKHEALELFGSRGSVRTRVEPGRSVEPHELEVVRGWFGEAGPDLPKVDFNGLRIDWQTPSSGEGGGAEPSAVLIPIGEGSNVVSPLLKILARISEITVTQSGSSYLEIRPAGSHKAVGLHQIASSRAVLREDVLAIGDNDNDAEMLDWAGIGVAVRNASSKAKSSADYVTRHGTFAGVVEVLRLVKNSRRYFNQ